MAGDVAGDVAGDAIAADEAVAGGRARVRAWEVFCKAHASPGREEWERERKKNTSQATGPPSARENRLSSAHCILPAVTQPFPRDV